MVATMPYIALQLIGMGVVIKAMGLTGEVPIIIAFVMLALYTYSSGLRAPALIAFVKDIMIYIVVLVAVVVVPAKLGGYGAVFSAANDAFTAKGGATGLIAEGQPVPRLRDARVRIGARGVHVSAYADRRVRVEIRRHHPQERDPAAGLYLAARLDRAARLHGLCRASETVVAE